jgi:hypothetical protein
MRAKRACNTKVCRDEADVGSQSPIHSRGRQIIPSVSAKRQAESNRVTEVRA